jgi:hypothetical protein
MHFKLREILHIHRSNRDVPNSLAKAISRRKCARRLPRYVWKNSSRRLDPLQFVQTLSSRHLAKHFEAHYGWQIDPGPELKFL